MSEIFAPRLIERLEPWITPDLEILARALGRMFDPILELAEEQGSDGENGYISAYGILLEVERATLRELPYLGMFVGQSIPQGATETEARALVKHPAGLERGTLGSIEAACWRVLGEGVPFTIQERTALSGEEDGYHFLVVVPGGASSAALAAAITAVKPAGVFFSIVEAPNPWIAGKLAEWLEITTPKWTELVEGDY